MNSYKKIIAAFGLLVFLFACEPRIDFDEGQWGDHAFIEDVLLYVLEQEDHQLQEYYEQGQLTPGIRRKFLNTSSSINQEAASVIVIVPSGTDMTKVGLVIRHKAAGIEPVGAAPQPGYLADFSGGPYSYWVVSSDGTKRDWIITFSN